MFSLNTLQSEKREITIAGAGLAGLSAAHCLAKEGYNVTVYEKNPQPGHNTHPYTCVLKNQNGQNVLKELKKLGINLKAYTLNPRVIKLTPTEEKKVGFRPYYLIELGQSDESYENHLYVQSLSEGVNFKFNTHSQDADIIATGVKPQNANIYGYGHLYRELDTDPEATYLINHDQLAPEGYTYLSTKGGISTLMAVSFNPNSFSQLKTHFENALKEFPTLKKMTSRAKKITEVQGHAFYHQDPYQHLTKNGKLYIGEAAGLQDAARGFGIRYAIISGVLAAKSIINKTNYRELMENHFKDEFKKNLERRKQQNKTKNKEYDPVVFMS